MIGFEDLMRKQAEIAAIAARMKGESDAARIRELTATLQREAGELQKMAGTFEREQQEKHGVTAPGGSGPAPTAEQQQTNAQMREMAEKSLAEAAGASPEAADAVARLRADPNFMGGLLAKK